MYVKWNFIFIGQRKKRHQNCWHQEQKEIFRNAYQELDRKYFKTCLVRTETRDLVTSRANQVE